VLAMSSADRHWPLHRPLFGSPAVEADDLFDGGVVANEVSPLLMLGGHRSMPCGQTSWNAIASTRVARGDHGDFKTSSEKRSVPACRNR